MEYWTQERMDSAVPRDMVVEPDVSAAQTDGEEDFSPAGTPGFALGYRPGESPTDPQKVYEVGSEEALTTPPFSGPSFSTDYINYAPFQRWSWFGKYLTYPISTIGKLFFSIPGEGNFVCSGSVIGTHVVATAGHCVSSGSGTFATNFLFCPSYNRQGSGVNPARGCWGWRSATTTGYWHTSSNFDRDYACIVTSRTNSTTGRSVGSQTGVLGRAYNWPTRQMTFSYGYPQGSPFAGNGIHTCASTEWYQRDTSSGDGQVAKYIGCDMTGGSSGGPWWLNLRGPNPSLEVSALDNSSYTDPGHPGGPYLNGVNSHRRAGWVDEMGSSQFRGGNAGDGQESEDVFAVCFGNQ
jgi:V8-like Glu-specific endopeptidase